MDTFRHLHPERVQFTFWSVHQKLRETNRGWRLDYFLLSKSQIEGDGERFVELVDSSIMDA